MGDGVVGGADGDVGADTAVSGGKRSWVNVSKSSHSPRVSPFLLSAKNPYAWADGSPQLKLDPPLKPSLPS